MAFTQQFFDAGHKYGFDNMDITPAQIAEFDRILGTPIAETPSWGNSAPAIGQPLTDAITFSGGFTGNVFFTLTSSTSAVLSGVAYTRTDTNELLYVASGTIPISTTNIGDAIQDWYLFSGADNLYGNSYNNALKGYGGNDRIDGGAGTDTAYFSGFKTQYQITNSGTSMIVSGPDGTDTLVNIERLRFDDTGIAYDVSGSAGQAYRLYQAAFDRAPDKPGLGFQMKAIDGFSIFAVAQNFIDSPEFNAKYGSLNDGQFVTQLYQNVLHRAPDPGGFAFHTDNLANGMSRAQVLVGFSESPENQAALIGVIQGGMEFIA